MYCRGRVGYEWLSSAMQALRGIEPHEVMYVLNSSSDRDWVPVTPEGVTELMEGLTFDLDAVVPEQQVPPVLADGDDALVPASAKIPLGLDTALREIAAQRGISKSDLMRRFLSAGVAAERAGSGDDVLVPLSEVLRAVSGLGGLPPHRIEVGVGRRR